MSNLRLTKEDFDMAFKRLNELLHSMNIIMDVRAIGGYAMLRNHLRDDGYSEDVDSVTKDWDEEVVKAIKQVGKEQNLLEDWLNNDPINLVEVVEVLDELEWIDDDSFSNIRLKWADIDSTFLLKVRAYEGGGLVPRKTDKADLFRILFKLNEIRGFDDLVHRYPFILDYPRCAAFLESYDWN